MFVGKMHSQECTFVTQLCTDWSEIFDNVFLKDCHCYYWSYFLAWYYLNTKSKFCQTSLVEKSFENGLVKISDQSAHSWVTKMHLRYCIFSLENWKFCFLLWKFLWWVWRCQHFGEHTLWKKITLIQCRFHSVCHLEAENFTM